jgi:hypothetical protein
MCTCVLPTVSIIFVQSVSFFVHSTEIVVHGPFVAVIRADFPCTLMDIKCNNDAAHWLGAVDGL